MHKSIPTAYWPPFYYYYLLSQDIAVESYETYQKRSFRNKCNILSSQGVKSLSVPLDKGKNAGQLITDVTISYQENWDKQHLSSISTCYRKSPYYLFYIDKVEALINQNHTHLYTLNHDINNWVLATFFDKTDLISSSSFNKTDFTFLNTLFQDLPIMYGTVYSGIEDQEFATLSILDMIFNVGPEIAFYLEDVRKALNSVYFCT